ncbi:MAG: 3-deoxy-manno-octulosonate cytidylyltransferase [Candidatus Sumerlaeaceae bacterium]|nr:3-deoxy-manno-octulosonate cytidylyltransferase [Candidatus Sumerlaeaceae bacterium]
MKVVGVIPARYASTRLPAKPLHPIAGKPLVQWVWEAASRAQTLNELVVATDDERIAATARGFGAEVAMTPAECPSGTDRVAAALEGREADIAVNIQGDEPLMPAENIDACVRALLSQPDAAVSTPMVPLNHAADLEAPHVVKVVTDSRGWALYFSRSPIPNRSRLTPEETAATRPLAMKHLGLYVYRRDALKAFVAMKPSRYELIEKLEQLRFLEAGYRILMVPVTGDSIGVDTPEDAEAVERMLAARG